MDIYKKNEIDTCIEGYFVDAIKGFYEGEKYFEAIIRKDMYNEALPCIAVQWWYYEEYNKIYIYYDINEVYFIPNRDDLKKRVNTRILGSIFNDLGIHAEIVYNVLYGDQKLEPLDCPYVMSNEKITYNVLTYWKVYRGGYDFIHDSHILVHKMLDNNLVVSPEKEQLINEYISKVAIIARNYEAYDIEERNNRIPDVFREIKNLFREYFNYELPDPDTYDTRHPNCGPNMMFLDIYTKEVDKY